MDMNTRSTLKKVVVGEERAERQETRRVALWS